jgi:hypothetical protein
MTVMVENLQEISVCQGTYKTLMSFSAGKTLARSSWMQNKVTASMPATDAGRHSGRKVAVSFQYVNRKETYFSGGRDASRFPDGGKKTLLNNGSACRLL